MIFEPQELHHVKSLLTHIKSKFFGNWEVNDYFCSNLGWKGLIDTDLWQEIYLTYKFKLLNYRYEDSTYRIRQDGSYD